MQKRILVVVALLALLVSTAFISAQFANSETSRISDIDVGQGDAALIQDPNGFDVLIDGGPTEAGPAVVDYIRTHTDKSIEVILVTHEHADHVGGLVAVLQASDISVGEILYNGYSGTTQSWKDLVKLANAESIPMVVVQFPTELHWGQLDAYILNPAPGLTNPDINDASIVVRIDYKNNKFLFTADINSTIEATVVARKTPVAADMLKVGHHGSGASSSSPFLAAVQPTWAVISVGAGNSYGFPAPGTLGRLASAGIKVLRTDRSGTIVMTSDGMMVYYPPSLGNIRIFLPVMMGGW